MKKEGARPPLSRKIMSVLSQAESRTEDERTRYEITGIKGRVKSRARTGRRRNRNITIGINSVPRTASFRHLSGVSYRHTTSFLHPFAASSIPRRLIVRFAIKISHENPFRPGVSRRGRADPRATEIITRYRKMLGLSRADSAATGCYIQRIIKIFHRAPVLDRARPHCSRSCLRPLRT